jgi:hypothetical protein
MTPAEMTRRYLQLRDKIKSIEARHQEELTPYRDLRFRLETALLDHLNRSGLDSLKSEHGTAFKSTVTSVTVKDWPVTLDYIKRHQLWDLLEARVAKGAAVEVMTESEKPIPGVEISSATVLRVRSA